MTTDRRPRTIEGYGSIRRPKIPFDCAVKRQTLTGWHRPNEKGTCDSCQFQFKKSEIQITGDKRRHER